MPVIERIAAFSDELTEIRRDFHAHPELGFEEVRTSAKVAEMLESWGIETHRSIGKTGVVGVLQGAREGKRIGLRADMDALPIHEQTNLPYRSKTPGVMHACGHDSHTTMLLGAARYLAETRDFAGTAVFIFQPAEEGLGGARAMLADGLFDRFPCDEIYGIHNNPYGDPNVVSVKPGIAMAGADFFDITITGSGSHAATPEYSKDPILVSTALVQQLQSVVSRNADPIEALVLSVTQIHAGAAYNVIPEEAKISGTIRFFSDDLIGHVRQRIRKLCAGLAEAYEVDIAVEIRDVFTVLENDAALSDVVHNVAKDVVGDDLAEIKRDRKTGSEDFADMLKVVPGAYFTVGHSGSKPLHNAQFMLDDAILPVGASMFARLVQTRGA